MQARLRRMVVERGRALAAVSHDLRTPLTTAKLATSSRNWGPIGAPTDQISRSGARSGRAEVPESVDRAAISSASVPTDHEITEAIAAPCTPTAGIGPKPKSSTGSSTR